MLWTWGWTDPTWDMVTILAVLSLHNVYALSLDLRLSHVLEMWIDLLRGYQTLHRERVAIKVAFGFVLKHAARHGQSRWDLPLSTWERYLWAPRVIGSRNTWPCYMSLRVNLVRGSESYDREKVVSLEITEYPDAKGKACTEHCDGSSDMIFTRV